MSISCPNAAEVLLLQYIVGVVDAGSPVISLYKNDLTPVEATTIGDFTESTEAGYAAKTLTSASWTTTLSGDTATAVYSQETFSFTTGADVYGYFITDTAGALMWCERFTGAPFQLPTGGGTIAISPRVTLD